MKRTQMLRGILAAAVTPIDRAERFAEGPFEALLERVYAAGVDGVYVCGQTGEGLLLSATHTHASTGPIWPLDSNGYALLGGDAFDPRIFELTATGIADAIIEANGNLTPARLGVGSSGLYNASNNRSFEAFLNNL